MARQNILFCGGYRINFMQDLWDHFDFNDLKNALTSGKLQQWLTANSLTAECDAIRNVDCAANDADIQMLNALGCPADKLAAYQQKKRELAEKLVVLVKKKLYGRCEL